MMRKINYKSAFDFAMRLKDASGKEVPWPECDWDALFWTSSKPNTYRVSCIGGVYVNCFREADGSIHFVFNSHRMGKGTLHWEPHFRFPNGIYPDGIQDQFRKSQLGIELIDGDGDDVTDIPEVEVYMPAVYLTAYDLAVRNGYTGTFEDFVEYTNRFPQVVENAETVNALLSDFADGKAMIADALTRQGVDTASDESMQTMADKVLGLQLAVEGDPQYVEHDSRVGGYDLYNVMHNHKKAEYPYMYAVSFNAPTVTLSGADAYLCSDGYFTEESGTHKMPFAQEHYVIYYFRNRSFTLITTAARFINEMCIYNGAPIVNLYQADVRRLAVYGNEPFATDNVSAFTINGDIFTEIAIESLESGYVSIRCNNIDSFRATNLKALRGGNLLSYSGRIQGLSLPALVSISGGTVVNNASALTELSLPALESISGGTIVNIANSLTELSLPALTTVSGGTIVNIANSLTELSLPALTTVSGGTIVNTCAALTELSLPALESITGGTVVASCVSLATITLEAMRFNEALGGNIFVINPALGQELVTIYLPNMESAYSNGSSGILREGGVCTAHVHAPRCQRWDFPVVWNRAGDTVHLYFGADIDYVDPRPAHNASMRTTVCIHIPAGAILTLLGATALWDGDNLRQLLADLGDNTGNEPRQLRLGATNLALLTDEDIALAVAKNYTLS